MIINKQIKKMFDFWKYSFNYNQILALNNP